MILNLSLKFWTGDFYQLYIYKKKWKRNGDVLIVALEVASYVTPFL